MEIGKGSIVEWNNNSNAYSVRIGARAIVTDNFNGESHSVLRVKWLDDKANGQHNGGYAMCNFDIIKNNTSTPKRIPQNNIRQFEFTPSGKDIALFLAQLLKDKDFNIDEPMTDNYLLEVGYELGWIEDHTQYIISKLRAKFIIE